MAAVAARRFIALLGLCLALGCLLVGHGLLLPALTGEGGAGTAVVDANLASAIAEPIAQLTSSIAAVCAILVLICAPRAFGSSVMSTLALAASAICVADRFVLLPRVHEALGRVDLVSSAPASAMARFEMWQLAHQLSVASACALLAAVAWIVAHRFGSRAAESSPAASPESPTLGLPFLA